MNPHSHDQTCLVNNYIINIHKVDSLSVMKEKLFNKMLVKYNENCLYRKKLVGGRYSQCGQVRVHTDRTKQNSLTFP